MLEDTDDLTLFDGNDDVIDYFAWGGGPGSDDDDAASMGQWTNDEYVDTSLFIENQTLGRDMSSNDTDSVSDWENATNYADPFGIDRSTENGSSPGAQNIDFIIPEVEEIQIPIIATIMIFAIWTRKSKRKGRAKNNSNQKEES